MNKRKNPTIEEPISKRLKAEPNYRCIALFYANWCQHSKALRPQWEELKAKYDNLHHFVEYEVDEHPEQIRNNNIQGFPTIKMFKFSSTYDFTTSEYEGDRTLQSLEQFLLS